MECPTCHDANSCRDYEGPSCDTCGGLGFIGILDAPELEERAMRLAEHPAEVEQWLRERAGNAVRIGRQKTDPKDQAGWFEDALFFIAARALIWNARHNSHGLSITAHGRS